MGKLVESGARIDMQARNGITPLLMARANGDIRKAMCLIQLGASRPSSRKLNDLQARGAIAPMVAEVDAYLLGENRALDQDVVKSCTARGGSVKKE